MLVQSVKMSVIFTVKQRLKLNERLTLVYQKVKMTLTKVVLMLAILVLRNKVSVIFCKLL